MNQDEKKIKSDLVSNFQSSNNVSRMINQKETIWLRATRRRAFKKNSKTGKILKHNFASSNFSTTKIAKNSVSTTIATTTTEEVTEETTEEVTEETTADPGAETTEDPGAETSEDPNIGASSDQPTEETTGETTEPPTEEPVTRQHSDVYNNCMCVTNGSCRIVGGNSTVINDGSGNIDARIVNVRSSLIQPKVI